MGELEVKLAGKSLADYTNTQLRLALGAVLYTNTADMWKRYLNQLGYSGDVPQMLQKYYVDNNVPSQFRNYINAGASIFNPQHLFLSGEQGYVYDLNDQFAEKTAYRRNLLTYTDEWTPFAATNSTKSVTSGVLFFTETAVNNIHELSNVFGIVSGTTYTYQVKAKADLRGCINLGNSGYMLAKFNLRTGVVNFTSGGNPWFSSITASISNAGDGYYQCTVTATCLSTQPAANWRIGLSNNDNESISGQPSYLGVVGYGVYLKDIQVELGSTATDYQRVTNWNTELLAAFPQTALYLDSAGTTAASVNGLVGLVLDKSKGLALGAELTTNGDFSNGLTGWTLNAAATGVATVVDGALVYATPHSDYAEVKQLNVCTIGKWYRVEYEVTTAGSGVSAVTIQCGRVSITSVSASTISTGRYSATVLATHPDGFSISVRTDATIGIDNISVKELSGNHAYQTTTGNKPVLRGTPVGGNMVTNGDFASDVSGWSAASGGAISWVSGKMRVTNGGAGRGTGEQAFTTVIGKVYRVRFSATAGTAPQAFCGVAQGSGPASVIVGVANSLGADFYFTAVGTTTYVWAQPSFTTAGVYIDVDNIEVVDVSAGSVQAPYALQFDGVDDFLQTASVDFATVTSDGLARRNLLTFPTAFDNAAWTFSAVGSVAVANQVAAPDGTLTADLLRENTSTGNHYNSQSPTVTNTAHTFSVYYKIASGTRKLALYHAGTNVGRQFDAAGVISAGVFNTPAGGFGVEAIGNGWYRAWITTTPAAGSGAWRLWLVTSADALSYTGDDASGFYVWGAQLEVGSTASAFQDIGTDKMTVCHGVRKLSDAARGMVVESGTGNQVGSFALQAPSSNGANNYGPVFGGSLLVSSNPTGFAAPITNVVAIADDISADNLVTRVNGVEVAAQTSDQGTGNFANYVVYFGRRAGTALPFNGLMFSAICVGKATSATELANIERWTNQRTGAY
jgi:hypothetical protein